jgi:hypothetical protein
MADEFERDPLADQLRDSLARHAADAPRGDMLAERIIQATDRQAAASPAPWRRGWRTWALPLVAAGAVAGVVAAIVGIQDYHPSASHSPALGSQSPNVSILNTPLPTVFNQTSTETSPTPTRLNSGDLTNVTIIDLTFAFGEGWALASADCIREPGKTCTALLHTTDGATWKGMGGASFDVPGVSGGCAETSDTCVTNIRFADPHDGYAYGPSAFYMTTDGGAHWTHEDGGAIALETFNGTAIRVTAKPPSGCPGPCNVRVETSEDGSTTWTEQLRTDEVGVGGAQLTRGSHNAYLLLTRNPAGGADNERSTLYRSTDDGATWQDMGKDPCPQSGTDEIDSTAISAGGFDRVSVLCMTRQSPQQWHVATAEDAGIQFARQPGPIPSEVAPTLLAGDPDTVLVAAGHGLARSTDGGQTWQVVDDVAGQIKFAGFESQTEGRAVSADGKTIWTTENGGRTWTPTNFG